MHEGGLKVGDLISYCNIDQEIVYGLVVKLVGWKKEAGGEAVTVVWMDDGLPTYENIDSIIGDCPNYNYLGVVSGSR